MVNTNRETDALQAPKEEFDKLPKSVDREQFTEVLRKLIATPPLPKSDIPRKRATKKARPAK